LQFALSLYHQPGGAKQRVAACETDADQQFERQEHGAAAESGDNAGKHHALGDCSAERADEEQAIPHYLVPARGLDPEFECDATQDQRDQHQGDFQVQRGQHDAVSQRKRDQQDADTQHQPGFVGIPERSDRSDHQVLVLALGKRQQDADAKVEAVENHVGENRKAHQHRENQRQVELHV
jgi:hypothetical protein